LNRQQATVSLQCCSRDLERSDGPSWRPPLTPHDRSATRPSGDTRRYEVLEAAAHAPHEEAPFGLKVKAVTAEELRPEFYSRYPAEGDTEEKRGDAKRKAYNRALKDAQELGLIGVRGEPHPALVWLAHRDKVSGSDFHQTGTGV
jgi:hypothetical protein